MPPDAGFGAYNDDDFAKPRSAGRKWFKRSFFTALALVVVGGGLYGGYRWTQTQYYVGANDEHVALYRGISQDLAWVNLSKVEENFTKVELKYLPPYQRKQVEDTIAEGSKASARTKIEDLSKQAAACKKDEQRRESERAANAITGEGEAGGTTGTKPKAGTSTDTKPNTATPTPGPSLSEEEQKLASNCGKQ